MTIAAAERSWSVHHARNASNRVLHALSVFDACIMSPKFSIDSARRRVTDEPDDDVAIELTSTQRKALHGCSLTVEPKRGQTIGCWDSVGTGESRCCPVEIAHLLVTFLRAALVDLGATM